MKRTLLLFLIGLATLAVAAPEKKSLYDYYLTLPAEALRLFLASGKPFDAESRKTIVKVRDDQNGYLELDAKQLDGAESNPVLALFVRKGKAPLVAVATALGDSTFLNCMAEADGQWTDVTAEVLPKIDDAFLDAQHRKIYPTFPKGPARPIAAAGDHRVRRRSDLPARTYSSFEGTGSDACPNA
jgi:hypothetical protein